MHARTRNAIEVAHDTYDPSDDPVTLDDEYERFNAIAAGVGQIVNRVTNKQRGYYAIEFAHTAEVDGDELRDRIMPLLHEFDSTGILNPTGTMADGKFNTWELDITL